MAAGLYREGESTYQLGTPRLAFKAFERLEPCAGKLASTVLRGEGRSNAPFLPGERPKDQVMKTVYENPKY